MRKQQQPPAQEPEKFERWTAQRKAANILELLKGQISVPEGVLPARFHTGVITMDHPVFRRARPGIGFASSHFVSLNC